MQLWSSGRVAEGGTLLRCYVGQPASRVQIPAAPYKTPKLKSFGVLLFVLIFIYKNRNGDICKCGIEYGVDSATWFENQELPSGTCCSAYYLTK